MNTFKVCLAFISIGNYFKTLNFIILQIKVNCIQLNNALSCSKCSSTSSNTCTGTKVNCSALETYCYSYVASGVNYVASGVNYIDKGCIVACVSGSYSFPLLDYSTTATCCQTDYCNSSKTITKNKILVAALLALLGIASYARL